LAFAAADETGPVVEIFPFDTSEARKLLLPASPGNVCLDLSWSRDGRYFAYVDTFGDRTAEVTQIWVLRVADQESFPLTDGRMNDWSPSWSPDGRAVYFVSNRGGGRDLWTQPVEEDGRPAGEPQRLTTGVGMQQAAFSPDGRRLIYSRGGQQVNVWRVPILADRPATWADAEQLTFEQAFIQFLDVSRDGQWLIFSSDRSGNQDLWKMPVGGGEFQHLTTNPTPDWHPRLSPDGERVVFYSYRSGNRDIWVKSAEGGPALQLTDDPARDVNAAWSPDGRTLAFSSLRSGNEDVWVVPAEGGEPRQLTDDPATDRNAEWSADGRWVYFVSTRSGESRLWRVSPEGGEAEPVTTRSATVARASADGDYIYYLGPGRDIWAISLEDGTEVAVTDLRGRPGARSIGLALDSKHLYFNWGSNVMDLWVMDVVRE
jgi:Tol biopolymer transport system component